MCSISSASATSSATSTRSIFRMNQREIKRRAYRKGGRVSLELSYFSFEEQLKNLLPRAVGRQVRRSPKGGMEWPPPIAPGFKAAPSVSTT